MNSSNFSVLNLLLISNLFGLEHFFLFLKKEKTAISIFPLKISQQYYLWSSFKIQSRKSEKDLREIRTRRTSSALRTQSNELYHVIFVHTYRVLALRRIL